MVRKVAAGHGRLEKARPRRTYDFASWVDGSEYFAYAREDYEVAVSFKNAAHYYASKHNLHVVTSIEEAGERVRFRFFPREDTPKAGN